MLVGILGAIAQDDVRRILSFNIVSHIGYMAMGIGLFTVAGIAGAIFYVVHHIVAMTTLFLTAGLIEHIGGSSRLSRLGEMVRSAPVVATLFLRSEEHTSELQSIMRLPDAVFCLKKKTAHHTK